MARPIWPTPVAGEQRAESDAEGSCLVAPDLRQLDISVALPGLDHLGVGLVGSGVSDVPHALAMADQHELSDGHRRLLVSS